MAGSGGEGGRGWAQFVIHGKKVSLHPPTKDQGNDKAPSQGKQSD